MLLLAPKNPVGVSIVATILVTLDEGRIVAGVSPD